MRILLMGVSCSGKTTIAKHMSAILNCNFIEGDDFHPEINKIKMNSGIPLNEQDRLTWLEEIKKKVKEEVDNDEHFIIACSALKSNHRDQLYIICPDLITIWLIVHPSVAKKRIESRKNHFMSPNLIESQFLDLEPPTNAVKINAEGNLGDIILSIVNKLEHFVKQF